MKSIFDAAVTAIVLAVVVAVAWNLAAVAGGG